MTRELEELAWARENIGKALRLGNGELGVRRPAGEKCCEAGQKQ